MKPVVFSQNLLLGQLLSEALTEAGHQPQRYLASGDWEFNYEDEDVVLVALSTLDQAHEQSIRSLRSEMPDIPIVVQCPSNLVEAADDRLGDIVNAIIPDDKPFEVLIGSMHAAQSGVTVCQNSNRTDQAVIPKTQVSIVRSNGSKKPLSDREMAILSKVSDGYANKEIARELDISDSTVKVHLRSIFQKVGVRNRTQAALWAKGQTI